jgi:hypothetical protein
MKQLRKWLGIWIVVFLVGQTWSLRAENLQTTVYFPDKQGVMVPELRVLPERECALAFMGTQLLQGPENKELGTAIPVKTAILKIWSDHGVVYIDFTKELFSYGGGTFREQSILGQIVLTFTENFGVQGVQILVEGERMLAPEGSPTDQPLTRAEVLLSLEGRTELTQRKLTSNRPMGTLPHRSLWEPPTYRSGFLGGG